MENLEEKLEKDLVNFLEELNNTKENKEYRRHLLRMETKNL